MPQVSPRIIGSINEPGFSRRSFSPASINEPPDIPTGEDVTPVITTLTPDTADLAAGPFTLVIDGSNLFAGSGVLFDGVEYTPAWDGTSLSIDLTPGPEDVARVVQCWVHNGEVVSAPAEFTYTLSLEGATQHAAPPHHDVDPDDLEDEIEQEIEDGDIKPLHPPRRKKRR